MTDEGVLEPAGQPVDRYAVVEIMGHRRCVGRVMEVERYGAKMLRIDIPKNGDFANGFVTQFYGGASIFCETPTTLEMVQRENRWSEPEGLLTLPSPEPAVVPFPEPATEPATPDDQDVLS